jgi:uncharacterized 2Fe-2S/4Fe-4S cluster protein (DUF4445 family)
MPRIELLPAATTLEVASGTTLVEAARAAGVEIELPCGGEGSCGRCLVRVSGGEVDAPGSGRLPPAARAAGYVPACVTRALSGTVTVEVPDRLSFHDRHAADDESRRLVRAELQPQDEEIAPLVDKLSLRVAPAQLEDGLSDLDRLARAIGEQASADEVVYTLSVMRAAAAAVREDDGQVTVSVVREPHGLRVTAIEAGDTTARHYGIAVDIGTTTVAVQLSDLNSGRILATASDYNAQIPCGVDVISRINYAAKPGRLEELQSRVLTTINQLLCEVAAGCSVSPAEIGEAVLSGNTVMTHLVLGLAPEQIRLEPYTPTVLEVPEVTAAGAGIGIGEDAPVRLSPCVGSYVGGDITAGLLCTDLATGSDEIAMLIDVGTNGEIVLGSADFLMACACSSGPAFDGGGIDCGMRVAAGAIDSVSVDRDSAQPTWSTIAGAPPLGICGSGMIDLLANLLRTGWIDRRGRLDRSRPSPVITIDGKRASYLVVPAAESATGAPIVIGEAEIESIIRAKAAVYSAAALMLQRLGLSFDDLATIYIAGSFGRAIDLNQAITVGMLPDVPISRFSYLGNASLLGSTMALVSPGHRRRQLELARRMTYVELSTDQEYMDQYTAALFLPHTNLGIFPSVGKRLAPGEQGAKNTLRSSS